jgi:phage tail-like protein
VGLRAAVPGLESPHPLATGLPPAFFGSRFTGEFVAAFDDVLAPVFATLDHLDAYLDPRYAPEDFLRWLSGWLGVPVDERWPAERLRAHLAKAVEAVLWRGTLRGVAAAVCAYTGEEPEVTDTGGVAFSTRPNGPLPGTPSTALTVRVRADPAIDRDVLERIVAAAKPAQVPHVLTYT